jgi:hypothetical protein
LLIVTLGWPAIFFLNVPIGIASILASRITIDESRDEDAPRRVDWYGLITLSVFAFSLVWGLIRLDTTHGGLLQTIWPFIVSAAAFTAFVAGELRIEHAMVDLRLFCNRSFSGDAFAVFSLSAALVAFIFFLTLYLQNALQFDPLQTGVHLLPMTILVGICAPIAGRYVYSVGPRWIITAGLALSAIGAMLITRVTPADTQAQWTVLVPSFVLIGIGIGSVFLTTQYNAALSSHHFPQRVVHAVETAGPQAGSAALQQAPPRIKRMPIFPELSRDTRSAWIDSFATTMWIAAGLVACGAVVAALTIRKEDLRA